MPSDTLSESDSDLDEEEVAEGSGNDEKDLEPWVDCIKRVTRTAEEAARFTGIKDWIVEQSRRKWMWGDTWQDEPTNGGRK